MHGYLVLWWLYWDECTNRDNTQPTRMYAIANNEVEAIYVAHKMYRKTNHNFHYPFDLFKDDDFEVICLDNYFKRKKVEHDLHRNRKSHS